MVDFRTNIIGSLIVMIFILDKGIVHGLLSLLLVVVVCAVVVYLTRKYNPNE